MWDIHDCIMGRVSRRYSQKRRVTEWRGQIREYVRPEKIEEQMQCLIDVHNSAWGKTTGNPLKLVQVLTHWIVEFMHVHPFDDGNGRLMRIVLFYLLQSAGRRYGSLDLKINYTEWCDLLQFNKKHQKALVYTYVTSMCEEAVK